MSRRSGERGQVSRLRTGRARARTGVVVVTAIAVLLAVVGVRASIAQTTASDGGCDRARVVAAWRFGGSQVRAAAQAALVGSDADVCAFLTTNWAQPQRV